MSRAQAWIKRHKKASFASLAEDGSIIFEHFDEKGILVETVAQEQLVQKSEKMDFDRELREDRVIFLFSHIDDFEAEDICKRLLTYDKLDSEKPVKLFICSYGGSVYASFAITDMIEYVQCPVETIGIGKIMSGGLLIFMAGDKRYISQTASILSHRFSTMKSGSQAELKADQREDEIVHQRMIDHYIKFSNLEDKKEVEAKLLKETNVWLTPEEALGYGLADEFFDKDWSGEEEEGSQAATTYNCECIKCGYTMKSTKHCADLKCPKCGAQMRRKERPGPGQEAFLDENYKYKLGGYGLANDGSPAEALGSPKSEFGYYPSVARLSEIYFLLDRLQEDTEEQQCKILQKIKGILKHWTGQPYPTPSGYWLPDEAEDVVDLEEMHNTLDQLIASDEAVDYRELLQEVKAILSRIVEGDFFYPRVYSSLEEVKNMGLNEGFITEPVSIDWLEEDANKPFRFRGKALKVNRMNKNNRRYKKEIVERALKEARRLGERGRVLTVMSGHPSGPNDTDPSRVIGKVVFGDIDMEGFMPYEATLSDTNKGLDIQKLLKDRCIGDVSLRSKGRTAAAKMDGQPIEDVVDLHYKGLDMVIAGSEEGAGVDEILNSYLLESYWEGPAEDLLEAIGGSKTLPLDPSGAWDGAAAERRMRSAAGGPNKEDMNWGRYQKGFVWYDATDKENFGSYKLPFADIVGGKLTAVWGGVNGAMGAVNGARTPLKMSPVEKKSAYNFLVSYYKRFDKTPPAFKGELLGGDTEMKIEELTIEDLKGSRTDLVEAIRTEEKDKLHKDIEKTKKELKGAKEAKEKFETDLEEAKVKFEADLQAAKEGKDNTGGEEIKEAKEKIEALEEKVKELGEQVVNLEAEKKLRESKEVYVAKIKEAGLTEEMSEGLEEICLGKKDEDMDKLIEARVELIKKVKKSEPVGLSEKKEGLTEEQKLAEAKKREEQVREAFGGKKKEEKKE